MWTSQKSLNSLVQSVLADGRADRAYEFDAELKKNRPAFHALLKNSPKNASDRELVRKAASQPVNVRVIQQKICLTDDFIEEALIISDLFDLNEMAAVELLLTAEGQQPSYPDLTRGLVAVLLYYDQQRCSVDTLRWLIEARPGRRWAFDTVASSPDIAKTVSDITAGLWRDGLLGAILDLLPAAKERQATARLEEQRALGNARHRRQFAGLCSQIRHSLADCVFLWACQTPLSAEELLTVMRFLQRDLPPPSAAIDRVHAALILAVLTSFDCSGPDGEEPDESHPLLAPASAGSGNGFAATLHQTLRRGQRWQNQPVQGLIRFAWGVAIRRAQQTGLIGSAAFSQAEGGLSASDVDDDDGEASTEAGIVDGAFVALASLLAPSGDGGGGAASWCRGNEWSLRCLHYLLTDYVCLMPMQVKSLRDSTDKAARIASNYAAQGVQPPSGLRRDFEDLLSILASLYPAAGDCDLTLDYWLGGESISNDHFNLSKTRPSNRQVALAKFLRLASDVVLAPSLYIPFLRLLARLACGRTQARACYAMLRAGTFSLSRQASVLSWDHFYASLRMYLKTLQQELPTSQLGSGNTVLYPHLYQTPQLQLQYQRQHLQQLQQQQQQLGARRAVGGAGISPLELEGLMQVLLLIGTVAHHEPDLRFEFCENTAWQPIGLFVGFLTCTVPLCLKARLLSALTVFAETPQLAATVWQALQQSRCLTPPGSFGITGSGVASLTAEVDEAEARVEEFPLTRATLRLLLQLLLSQQQQMQQLQQLSQHQHQQQQQQLYSGKSIGLCIVDSTALRFVNEVVFLKHSMRSYRRPSERWNIASACLEIYLAVVQRAHLRYNPAYQQQLQQQQQQQSQQLQLETAADIYLISLLLSESQTLRQLLQLLSDASRFMESQAQPQSQQQQPDLMPAVHRAAFYALLLLDKLINYQEELLALLREYGGGGLGVRPAQLLATVSLANSRRPDHLASLCRIAGQGDIAPHHGRLALSIFRRAVGQTQPHNGLVRALLDDADTCRGILRGFAFWLEADQPAPAATASSGADASTDDALAMLDASAASASAMERVAMATTWLAANVTTLATAALADEGEDAVETAQRQDAEFAALDADAAPSCRTSVLLLLLQCLDRSAPNLAHFLLGYRMDGRLSETQLQEPGVHGFPKTCLHALMSLMRRAADPGAAAAATDSDHADFALAYRLAYCLALNGDTSNSFLRYLRSGGSDFLAGQLTFLLAASRRQQPAPANRRQALTRLQKAWLLRLLAVDLRCATLANQRGHAAKLARALLGSDWTVGIAERSAMDQVYSFSTPQREDTLLSLLDSLASEDAAAADSAEDDDATAAADLDDETMAAAASGRLPRPELRFRQLNRHSVEEMLRACEEQLPAGARVTSLQALAAKLYAGAAAAAAASGAGVQQRAELEAEIRLVLRLAERRNARRLAEQGRLAMADGWRQTTEVLFAACPPDWTSSTASQRRTLLAEFVSRLLAALGGGGGGGNDGGGSGDFAINGVGGALAATLSNTVALLTSGLVHSLLATSGQDGMSGSAMADDSATALLTMLAGSEQQASPSVGGTASSTIGAESNSRELQQLLQLLRLLARAILQHRSSAQSIRGNLYAAACFLLSAAGLLRSGRPAVAAFTAAAAAAAAAGGRDLAELACRDAADAHPVTRLLATSLLDSAMRLDPAGSADWQTHLASRGYLDHFVDTLVADSEALEAAVTPSAGSCMDDIGGPAANSSDAATLAPLFLAASRLALLCRLASSQAGAAALLHSGAIARLADCAAFGRRPSMSSAAATALDLGVDPAWLGVGPEPAVRYRLLLLPALRAAGAVMASLGWKNQLAARQALTFVDRHWDAVAACSGLVVRFPDDPEQWEELGLFASLLRQCCSALVTHQRSPLLGRVERWLSEALVNAAPLALQLPESVSTCPIDHRILLRRSDALAALTGLLARLLACDLHLQQQEDQLTQQKSSSSDGVTSVALLPPYLTPGEPSAGGRPCLGHLVRLSRACLASAASATKGAKTLAHRIDGLSELGPEQRELLTKDWLPLLYQHIQQQQQLEQQQQQHGPCLTNHSLAAIHGGDLRAPLTAALVDWRLSASQLAVSLEHLTFAVWSHVDCYLRWARLSPGSASAAANASAVTSTPGIRRLTAAASPEQQRQASISSAAGIPVAGFEDDTRVRQYLLGGRFESELATAPNLADDWFAAMLSAPRELDQPEDQQGFMENLLRRLQRMVKIN